MVKIVKILPFVFLTLMMVGLVQSVPMSLADPPAEMQLQNKFQGTISPNEMHQFRFKNQFRFQIMANESLGLNLTCDCDQIQARNMTMIMNMTQDREMSMVMNASCEELGLMQGALVQTQTQTQYQFREMYVFHFDINGTDPFQAQLQLQTEYQQATWAFYNETDHYWQTVQSRYENGYVIAETDHFSTWTILVPKDAPTPPVEVNQNKYQGSIGANVMHQFTFRNKFQFQIQTNVSLEMDVDCDVDTVGEREFTMLLNTTQEQKMTMLMNGSNADLGLTNGSLVRETAQYRYRYQERFVLNVSLNATEAVQAQLCINVENQYQTWAYYDEETEEWVPVTSTYQNGYLYADTDHFSLWTILTVENVSDTTDTTIPGFLYFGVFMLAGVVFLMIKKNR